jgi:hypothetical protein
VNGYRCHAGRCCTKWCERDQNSGNISCHYGKIEGNFQTKDTVSMFEIREHPDDSLSLKITPLIPQQEITVLGISCVSQVNSAQLLSRPSSIIYFQKKSK